MRVYRLKMKAKRKDERKAADSRTCTAKAAVELEPTSQKEESREKRQERRATLARERKGREKSELGAGEKKRDEWGGGMDRDKMRERMCGS